MTPEQHRLHIQDIQRMLYKADYGMGMPRDPYWVAELQAALEAARREAAKYPPPEIGWLAAGLKWAAAKETS